MKYDYIFAGVGLASLLILQEMMQSNLLRDKNVLLLEPNDKNSNDRTWCFWEQDKGEWDDLITKKWNSALFVNHKQTTNCISKGDSYKMIESASFYSSIIERLNKYENVVWKKEKVLYFEENPDRVEVTSENEVYTGAILFNNAFDFQKLKSDKKYPLLQQHFVGWFIKTKVPAFDANCATFMDFTIPQKGNTRFMYVLPLSETEALIEYTLFSADLLEEKEYEAAIESYLSEKGIASFEILKKEKGNIPMTAYPFWKNNSKHVLNIGTAGGWTKASSGYTFQNSTKQSKKVVAFLKKDTVDFRDFNKTNRFWFYDKLFIDVLYKNNELGYGLFSGLFSKVEPEIVLRFLDEETTVLEELKVIMACPKKPFLKALMRRLIDCVFPKKALF